MGSTLQLVIGISGTAATLLLYSAPILTFKRVLKKRSTEGFSSVPYIVAFLNCLIYTWYALPVVSNKWENLLVVFISATGVLLQFCFILIYFCFASPKGKKLIWLLVVPAVMLFCTIAIISAFALRDHHHRKVLVGSIGLGVAITMYGSPLIAAKQVIKTKSVEFMPFYLSFFTFLASSLWMAYGFLRHDIFIAAPNIVGCPLGIFQLVLYFMYRNKMTIEESNKQDVEKMEKNSKIQQPEPN